MAQTATKVPRCKIIEKNSPPSSIPNTRNKNARCPLDDTGKNSVSPCVRPNIIACQISIYLPKSSRS